MSKVVTDASVAFVVRVKLKRPFVSTATLETSHDIAAAKARAYITEKLEGSHPDDEASIEDVHTFAVELVTRREPE